MRKLKYVSSAKGTPEEFRSAILKKIDGLKGLESATNTSNIAAKPIVGAEEDFVTKEEYFDLLEDTLLDQIDDLIESNEVAIEIRKGVDFTVIVTDPLYGRCRFDFIVGQDLQLDEYNENGRDSDYLEWDAMYVENTIRHFLETGETPESEE